MEIFINQNLILASTSFIRKKILNDVGLDFIDKSPNCDEEQLKLSFKKDNPNFVCADLAYFLACQKALSVSNLFKDSLVIGSDQLCEFDNKEVPKSKNKEEAIENLKRMNGKTHFLNNSVVVSKGNNIIFKNNSIASLKLRNLSDFEIESYVEKDKSWGCSGSYKYESLGKHLFSDINGDFYGILGLSIQPLISYFYKEKILTIK